MQGPQNTFIAGLRSCGMNVVHTFILCSLQCSDYLQCFDTVDWERGRASGL